MLRGVDRRPVVGCRVVVRGGRVRGAAMGVVACVWEHGDLDEIVREEAVCGGTGGGVVRNRKEHGVECIFRSGCVRVNCARVFRRAS